jgi:hypothetical protein
MFKKGYSACTIATYWAQHPLSKAQGDKKRAVCEAEHFADGLKCKLPKLASKCE